MHTMHTDVYVGLYHRWLTVPKV